MGRAHRKRRHGCVDDVAAGLDALEQRHRGKPGSIMRMQVDRDLYRLFQRRSQLIGNRRRNQRRHVLDTDRIRARVLKLFGILDEIFDIVHRRQRVGNRCLHVRARLFCRLDRRLQIADVVKRVENTDDIDSVVDRFLYKIFNRIISIVAVAEHILSAEQHLQLCVRHIFADHTQPLPRVLVEKTDTRVKRGAAPAFAGIKADLIHRGQDWKHLVETHTRRDQGLMRVAQDGFTNFYLLSH